MKLSRQVGTTAEVLNIFVRDATSSSGAGLANILGSTVTTTWWRNDQSGASSGTASTAGAMGIYSTSAWVQINSSLALGWYQLGVPDGIFISGRSAAVHLYGSANMAPTPLEIELTKTNNQQYASSTVFLAHTSTSPANVVQAVGQPIVTSAAGILNVSTQTLSGGAGNITQVHGQTIVTSAAGVLDVNVIRILNSAVVTSGAGILNVSTQTIDKTGYFTAGTTRANVIEIYAQPAVTSGAGIFTVSTQAIDKGGYGVTTIAANITTNANLMQIYGSAAVTSGAGILRVSTQTLAAAGSDILTVYGSPIVTSGAGIFQVSTQTMVNPDNAGIAAVSSVVNNALTESYRANGGTGTIAQLMYEMIAHMGEVAITGTTKTINKLDHVTPAETFQLDSSTAPSSITRIT